MEDRVIARFPLRLSRFAFALGLALIFSPARAYAGGAPSADLSITVTDGVDTAIPGTDVTYTIVASNAGPDPVNAATVVAILSDSVSSPSPSPCDWTCVGAGGGTCSAAGSGSPHETVGLPVGGSVTFTHTCHLSSGLIGVVREAATVSSAIADPVSANNHSEDIDFLTPRSDLSVTKTDGVSTALAGGSVTYTMVVSNLGPSYAGSVILLDTPSALLNCTGALSASFSLSVGSTATFTATCAIWSGATGTLSNRVDVYGNHGTVDPNWGNNAAIDTDTVIPLAQSADLGISVTDGITTAIPGGTVTYTIVASNAGPSPAPGSTVTDAFPAALSSCIWTCSGVGGASCVGSGSGDIHQTINLHAGSGVTFTAYCNVSASASGTLSNTATVATTAGLDDPAPGNERATDIDALIPSANLGITMTDGVTNAMPGGSVTYTIVASNAGPGDASGSTVKDAFSTALACTWTCSGAGGGSCPAAGAGDILQAVQLPNGGSVTFTAHCDISPSVTGSLSNLATVTPAEGLVDLVPGNNSAADTDTLAPVWSLAISKTDGVTHAIPGQTMTYTIVASNGGPSSAFGVSVMDTLPVGLIDATWTCVGAGGGTCTPSGSGNLADSVSLPVGGSVSYSLRATLSADFTGTLSNTALLSRSPATASATDTTEVQRGVVEEIPTLGGLGLGALALALVALAVGLLRRRRHPLR